jgi:DNA-binding NarL/FixJ family response regulator
VGLLGALWQDLFMPSPAVSVLVVDDQAPFRIAARLVVRATAGFEVIGEAKSGEEAVEAVARLNPQLVLMDINMEGMGGIAATRVIRDGHKGTNVILLSTYDEEDLPADARTCGALAYIHKERFGPDILEGTWSSGGANGNNATN